jgi:hypothetical protein
VNTEAVAKVLAAVRQEVFTEMVYGSPRQPAEVVEFVGTELAQLFASEDPSFDKGEFYNQSEPKLKDE